MGTDGLAPFWCASKPECWPKPPKLLSFSMLAELEECPHRWALRSAEYPNVWDRRGYPDFPHTATIVGAIVHRVLELVAKTLSLDGVASIEDDHAIMSIKRLGGYSKMIQSCIDDALVGLEGNPRIQLHIDRISRELQSHIPQMRSRVQSLVARLQLCRAKGKRVSAQSGRDCRRALGDGSFVEVSLSSVTLGYRGVADLITIRNGLIEIRDYKTGAPKPKDEQQIRLYALLWARDDLLNPTGRLASKLTLSYISHDTEVIAPGARELEALEGEYRSRSEQVLKEAQAKTPEARPSFENCEYCSVKHLCEEYWSHAPNGDESRSSSGGSFGDLQLVLLGAHGPSSWDAKVTISPGLRPGSNVLLRLSRWYPSLNEGQVLRALGVHISQSEPDGAEKAHHPIVATMGKFSELFLTCP